MVLIRPATAADARAIAQVHVAAWRTTYRGIIAQGYIDGLSVDVFSERWQRRLADEAQEILVAGTSDRSIVGFAWGGATSDHTLHFDGELHAIYLLQEYQGRDIGRKLVAALCRRLLERGYTSMLVKVLAANPARHFYERLGAQWIRNEPHQVGADTYEACCYGWSDLRAPAGAG